MEILEVQKDITESMKKNGKRKLFGVLVIVDDFADDASVCRGSRGDVLKTLYVRGRHFGITVVVATQKYRLLSPVLRCQATALYCYKLRSKQDLDAFIEETSAAVNKNQLLKYYREATDPKFSFLYVNLRASPEEMFWIRYDYPLST